MKKPNSGNRGIVGQNGSPGAPDGFALAVVGDLAASREMDREERRAAQDRLDEALAGLNAGISDSLLCRANVTVGDEFEMLLSRPDGLIPALTWLGESLDPARVRLGFGRGAVYVLPSDPDRVHEADGPALHQARAALERAKKRDVWASANGFGDVDETLAALFEAIGLIRSGWSRRQNEIVHRLRSLATSAPVRSQKEVAQQLRITQGTVSSSLKAAHYSTIQGLEQEAQRLMESDWRSWRHLEDEGSRLTSGLDALPARVQSILEQEADLISRLQRVGTKGRPGDAGLSSPFAHALAKLLSGPQDEAAKARDGLLEAGSRLNAWTGRAVDSTPESSKKRTPPRHRLLPLVAEANRRLGEMANTADEYGFLIQGLETEEASEDDFNAWRRALPMGPFSRRLNALADWLTGEVDALAS